MLDERGRYFYNVFTQKIFIILRKQECCCCCCCLFVVVVVFWGEGRLGLSCFLFDDKFPTCTSLQSLVDIH